VTYSDIRSGLSLGTTFLSIWNSTLSAHKQEGRALKEDIMNMLQHSFRSLFLFGLGYFLTLGF
jgi:hypothetical protein